MIDSTGYDAVARAHRARARAEFGEWSAVLACRDEQLARIDASDQPVLRKELDRCTVTTELAQRLGMAENAVWRIVVHGEQVRDHAPATWEAFRGGALDAARAAVIADTLAKLTREESRIALDANVVEQARTLTVAELRNWLKRFRARIEPDETLAEAEQAVAERRVDISHNDDGTSWLNALLPTPVAIAVGNRIRKAAKALAAIDPETGESDRRTRDQKQADLLAYWLTNSTGTATDIRAEIAICIDATDLAGYTNGPGITRDGVESIPAAWVRELAASDTTLFRRLVLDPVGSVMDTTKLGYQPPGELRAAVHWRDGTCRVAGCGTPAENTDLDHALAHDRGGGTSAKNLRCLCRKHHNLKSHGLLPERFVTPPPRRREVYHWRAPVTLECDLVMAS